MSGETSLKTLLRTLRCSLDPETYVWISVPKQEREDDLPIPLSNTRMFFREAEGITLITTIESAERLQLDYVYRCKMITLDIHSSLEAVGFMAVIASKIAEGDFSSNPVSAYFHDHLFVKEEEAEDVLKLLQDLAVTANDSSKS